MIGGRKGNLYMDCQSSMSFSLMMLSFKDGVCYWMARSSLILQSKFVLPGVKMVPANDNQRQLRVFYLSRPQAFSPLRSCRWSHSYLQNLWDARYVPQDPFNKSRTVDPCNLILIFVIGTVSRRLKDINKNVISTLWIITKVSQKWYYDLMSLFENM